MKRSNRWNYEFRRQPRDPAAVFPGADGSRSSEPQSNRKRLRLPAGSARRRRRRSSRRSAAPPVTGWGAGVGARPCATLQSPGYSSQSSWAQDEGRRTAVLRPKAQRSPPGIPSFPITSPCVLCLQGSLPSALSFHPPSPRPQPHFALHFKAGAARLTFYVFIW